jgi:hypothetical protein
LLNHESSNHSKQQHKSENMLSLTKIPLILLLIRVVRAEDFGTLEICSSFKGMPCSGGAFCCTNIGETDKFIECKDGIYTQGSCDSSPCDDSNGRVECHVTVVVSGNEEG